MAFELYITTSNMLGKDLLTEFLEDESKRARKLVYYHGAEDTLTYDQHMLLARAGKRMAIQFEETEPGELLFALGTLLDAKPAGPVFVISDEALLPEGIMERYGIKMYTGNPKAVKKNTEKKTERKPRAKLTSKKQTESVKEELHGSEESETNEEKPVETVEPEAAKGTVNAETKEVFSDETEETVVEENAVEETDTTVEEPSDESDKVQKDLPEDNDTESNIDTEPDVEESMDTDADEESEGISEETEDESEEAPEIEVQTDKETDVTADASNESSDDAEIPDILPGSCEYWTRRLKNRGKR